LNNKEKVYINKTQDLTLKDIIDVARDNKEVFVEGEVFTRLQQGNEVIHSYMNNKESDVYGLNTGLGSQKEVRFSIESLADYNKSVIYDHTTSVGKEVTREVVRGTILFRIAALSNGGSGISVNTFNGLVNLLNLQITPYVQKWGSVGAADLAQLAQISLVLIGSGKAWYKGKLMSGEEVLKKANISPIELQPRDALALIGANSFSSSIASLAIWDAQNCMEWSETVASLSLSAYGANKNALRPEVLQRFSFEANLVGQNMLEKLTNVEMSPRSIQDPLSFRCIPQVHGTLRKALKDAEKSVLSQISRPLDNPFLHLDSKELISNGNFDATDLTIEMDRLRNIMYRIIVLHERRVGKLLMNYFSGYPSGLATKEGYVGLDVLHHTMLSLLGEATALAQITPVQLGAAAESVEDYASLATQSAQSLDKLVNIWQISVAIELIVSVQALSFSDIKLTSSLLNLYEVIKDIVDNMETPSEIVEEVSKFLRETNYSKLKESGSHYSV